MSYNALEVSEWGGKPIEFYKFDTASRSFCYTSAPVTLTLTVDGADYDFRGDRYITSPEFQQTTDVNEADIRFEVSRANPVAKLNLKHLHPSKIALTIYRRHKGDSEVRAYWTGFVKAIELRGDVAELTCETIIAASRKNGLQYEHGANCNHTPYVFPCPVNRNNFRHAATVVSVDSDAGTVTLSGIDSHAVDYFKGGEVELADGDGRDVLEDTIDGTDRVLRLTSSFPATSLRAGDSCFAVAGDDLAFTTCSVKMDAFGETNQGEAFGGFPYKAKDNPFKPGAMV
jgi:hypothetical protein